jgi:hypothetical protein
MRKLRVCEHIPVGLVYGSLGKAEKRCHPSLFVPFGTCRLDSQIFDFLSCRGVRQRQPLRCGFFIHVGQKNQQQKTKRLPPQAKALGYPAQECL